MMRSELDAAPADETGSAETCSDSNWLRGQGNGSSGCSKGVAARETRRGGDSDERGAFGEPLGPWSLDPALDERIGSKDGEPHDAESDNG